MYNILNLLFLLKLLFCVQIGNAWIDDNYCSNGMYDYFWTHGLISDETHKGLQKHCNFKHANLTSECNKYADRVDEELGNIDIYNIYAPLCNSSESHATYTVSCMHVAIVALLFVKSQLAMWGKHSRVVFYFFIVKFNSKFG